MPSPHIFHSYSLPYQLGHSWKIPSPHTHHPGFLSTGIHCGSSVDNTIHVHHPTFVSSLSTVVHSLKIPFPHTIRPFCLSPSAMEHVISILSIHLVSPNPLWHIPCRFHIPTSSFLPVYPQILWLISGRHFLLHHPSFLSLSLIHFVAFLEDTLSPKPSTLSYLLASSVPRF